MGNDVAPSRTPHRLRRLICVVLAMAPLASRAQGKAPRRIGWLSSENASFIDAVKGALRDLGYVEGRDYVLIVRSGRGDPASTDAAAREIVAQRPDLILAGATPNTLAAKRATGTIPILMYAVGDPVAAGFVESFARPGGNVTGVTNMGPELADKLVELLRLVVPRASRIAVLVPDGPVTPAVGAKVGDAIARAGVAATSFPVADMSDVERAFATMSSSRIEGLVVVSNTFAITNRERIAQLAALHRIPAIYGYAPQVEAGGLMSYGPDARNLHIVLAGYIDKLLKGATPADLPVQQPADFELAINTKTARALGIVFPPEILARADKRIE